jgi:CRP/FNR family cyclic AMP-dependent transcriptional regulator
MTQSPVKAYTPLKDIESVLPILSKIAMWGGVSDEQRKSIFKRLGTGVFKKGEYVFRKGDEPTYIYIVKKGKIELRISTPEVDVEKMTLSAGECFGVASLMAMQKHTNNAVAVEDSEVMVLSRQSLLELQDEDIALFALLMMNTARELARRLKLTDDILLCYMETHKNE